MDPTGQSSHLAAAIVRALMNNFIRANLKATEMVGVIMRIFSFSLVSWLHPDHRRPRRGAWSTMCHNEGSFMLMWRWLR
jgi:hypothetical protein